MQLLPGFDGGGGGFVRTQLPGATGTSPAPPPARTDPAIAAARKKQRDIELRRRGRRSSILTSRRGVTQQAPIARPQARKAELLGQTGG